MTVFLGLGSNIDADKNLRAAADLLRGEWNDIRFSSVYRTKARDVEDQADFLNAVARIETDLSAQDVLSRLQKIERTLKKDPPFRFGPRTIDLDLLLYGDEVIDTPSLTVPHPRMHERRFVLEPLCELIDPEGLHPILKKSWADLLIAVQKQQCEITQITL